MQSQVPRVRLLTGVIISALVLGACGVRSSGNYTALTADHPIAQIPEGLAVSVSPAAMTQDFGVQLRAAPLDALASGQVGAPWDQALAARPVNLALASAWFAIDTSGTAPAQAFVSLIIPNISHPERLDMYAWDGQAWAFVPSVSKGNQRIASVSTLPKLVGLFEAAPSAPVTAATVLPGEAVNTGAALNAVFASGVSAQANGSLAGQLPNLPLNPGFAVLPIVIADAQTTATVVSDPALRASHAQTLASFVYGGNYAGLVINYGGSAASKDNFTAFIRELKAQLQAQNKALLVQLPPLSASDYDWLTLGKTADTILIALPNEPTAFGDGTVDTILQWATGQVERARLRLITTALSAQTSATGLALLDYNSGLNLFGSATTAPDTSAEVTAGQPVKVALSGQARSLDYDPQAFAPRFVAADAQGQTRTVWLNTARTLRQRLALAEKYHLGGVVVTDLFRVGVPVDMLTALTGYQANTPAGVPPQPALVWMVSNTSGLVAQATTQPGEPYSFTPSAAGDYQISAQLQTGQTIDLGSVPIKVVEAQATPPPTTGGGTSGGNTGGSGNTGGNPGGNTGGNPGGGGFVPPPPITSGTFELGGQVPSAINNAAFMKQAGMKWVKFQTRGGGGDYIAAAKANGFKVLLSVIGDKGRVTDPNYWNEYAQWVGGLAAQGADAIEVWNEPNIDHEWPEGQINGATYTQLLAKAHAAIKAANPGTIVISGGPAPTGAEAAFPGRVMNDDKLLRQMADAGAANYMDCVGIHYNEGILSPTQTSGDPRDSFYSRYYGSMVDLYYNAFGGSRPLCFTELGYLTGEGYPPLPSFFAWAGNTTIAQQAQWLAEAASLSASSGKVRLMIIWNVDFVKYEGDPQAGYAIVRPNGACPACSALDAVMP